MQIKLQANADKSNLKTCTFRTFCLSEGTKIKSQNFTSRSRQQQENRSTNVK